MEGVQLVELELGDPPDAWRAAGFAVDADGVALVDGVGLRCTGAGGGIRSWTVRGVDAAVASAVDGLPGRLAGDRHRDDAGTAHPNTTVALDHLVIATPDCERTVDAFRALGCEPRRERTGGTAEHPIRQTFLRAGRVILEIVGPPEPPADPDVRARPASFWGLAFTVTDLDACAAVLGDALGAARDAVQPGRRIATLRDGALGVSVPTAFMTPAPGD